MKPKTLIGLAVMLGFGALLFLHFGEQVGGYMNFAEAEETGAQAHVVGEWVEEAQYQYDREQNIFSFYMKDEAGYVRLVHYANPKPANFEDAERLVVEGYTDEDVFRAQHILVKCPSKYNDAPDFKEAAS